MGFRRSVATLLTAAATVAACTGSTSPATQRTSDTAATTPASAYPPVSAGIGDVHSPDPLIPTGRTVLQQVVVGSSTAESGAVDDVTAVFAPGTSQFVAGALVLADAPATADATITWSMETNVGERTLFAATATVQPRSVVLSRAKSAGPLSEGIYRVRVTVGSESRDTVFVVSPIAGAAGEAAQAAATGSAAVLASDGTSDVPPAACLDDRLLPDCNHWFSRAAPPAAMPPCPPEGKPSLLIDQDVAALGGQTSIEAETSGCTPADNLLLAAGVAGASPQQVAAGAADIRWMGNTCALAGGSDLFGDVVQAAASPPNLSRQASTSIRLGELGPFPGLAVADPPLGELVTDLQTISFTAFTIALGATRGIKALDVTAPDGTVLAHAGRDQPAAACDLTMARFQAFASGAYTVQQDGKSVVELLLRAETFDGSVAQYPLRWPKKPTWSGHLVWQISQPVQSGTQLQDMSADVVVSETGPNAVTGTIHGGYTQTLQVSTCPSQTTAPGGVDATIAGTIDPSGMHLTVTPGASSAPTLTPCPSGDPPGQVANPLTFAQLAQLLATLTAQGRNRYSTMIDVTVPTDPYPYRVRATLTLVPLDQDPIDDGAFSVSPAPPPPP